MSSFGSLGIGSPNAQKYDPPRVGMLSQAQVFSRILEFTGYTVDDVINDLIARNAVRAYYGLYRFVEERCEELGQSPAQFDREQRV